MMAQSLAELMAQMQLGNYSATNEMTNPIINDIPPWMQYFTKDWLSKLPSAKMKYMEGWQENPRGPDYNVPLAFLSNMPEAIQWEDISPEMGARWHGYSKTPGGQWLKAPWHPTHHYEDEYSLREALKKALSQ